MGCCSAWRPVAAVTRCVGFGNARAFSAVRRPTAVARRPIIIGSPPSPTLCHVAQLIVFAVSFARPDSSQEKVERETRTRNRPKSGRETRNATFSRSAADRPPWGGIESGCCGPCCFKGGELVLEMGEVRNGGAAGLARERNGPRPVQSTSRRGRLSFWKSEEKAQRNSNSRSQLDLSTESKVEMLTTADSSLDYIFRPNFASGR